MLHDHSVVSDQEIVLSTQEVLERYCKSFDIGKELREKIAATVDYKYDLYNSLDENVREARKGSRGSQLQVD